MTRLILLLLIFLPTAFFGQSILPMDTLTEYPVEFETMITEKIDMVFQVDFTGDSKLDYIVRTAADHEAKIKEIWLTSDLVLFNTFFKYDQTYNFIRFINLDSDPEPEMYSATGDSDGIDYAIYDWNEVKGELELLFFFNPVIIKDEKEYWGYPWKTEGLMTKEENSLKELFFSIDHAIVRDGEITIPEKQKIVPVLFLIGTSTQSEVATSKIRDREWKTLDEIRTTLLHD